MLLFLRVKLAPEFITEGEEWINSEPQKMAELRGKVVLIKFWAFMCGSCQADMPAISALAEKYADKGLIVIGVHSPETTYEKDRDALKKQVGVLKVLFPVLTDNALKNWEAFEATNWPEYVIVDKGGNISLQIQGPGVENELETKIIELL